MDYPKIENYEIIKKIGEGNTGDVFIAKNSENGKLYAIKAISKNHQNISEIIKHYQLNKFSFIKYEEDKESEDYYFKVMEYFSGGSLFSIVNLCKSQNRFPIHEKYAAHILIQLMKQVIELEKNNIDYSYIKLSNLLVNFRSFEDFDNLNLGNLEIKLQIKQRKQNGKKTTSYLIYSI